MLLPVAEAWKLEAERGAGAPGSWGGGRAAQMFIWICKFQLLSQGYGRFRICFFPGGEKGSLCWLYPCFSPDFHFISFGKPINK